MSTNKKKVTKKVSKKATRKMFPIIPEGVLSFTPEEIGLSDEACEPEFTINDALVVLVKESAKANKTEHRELKMAYDGLSKSLQDVAVWIKTISDVKKAIEKKTKK